VESTKTVLAIDPGNSKCGLALAQRDGEGNVHLLWSNIVPRDQIPAKLEEAHGVAPFSMVIVGSGTTSKPLVAAIRAEMPSMAILVVDEKDTSFQARERYWEYNPRKGWRRFLPATLQTPPEPIDNYAALIIAERVLIA
jgi:RNase H-fold protein (predicted Holliday junction resolvase)